MLRHETPGLEKILAVLPTSKKNYEYVQGVLKLSFGKTIIAPYDLMQLQ